MMMWTTNQRDLAGFGGRKIFNRLYQQEQTPIALCVMIAGFGYTLQAPYLYYSKAIPFARGFDVWTIDLEYSRSPAFMELSDAEQENAFAQDQSAIRAFLEEEEKSRDLLFIGKSLGTTVIYELMKQEGIRERTKGCVWLTPGQERHAIHGLLSETDVPGLVVWGTDDRYGKDVDFASTSSRATVTTFSVDGGDHALDTGDRSSTLDHLAHYLDVLETFVADIAVGVMGIE